MAFLSQAFNVLSAIIEQRSQPGVMLECKVVEVRDVDVSSVYQSGIISGVFCLFLERNLLDIPPPLSKTLLQGN